MSIPRCVRIPNRGVGPTRPNRPIIRTSAHLPDRLSLRPRSGFEHAGRGSYLNWTMTLSYEEPLSPEHCRCRAHLTITRPLMPHRRGIQNSTSIYNLHGTTNVSRPILGTIAGQRFVANSWALPLPDRFCDSIDCFDVLEYVRDDEAMINEIARILRPGGTLRLRVPNAGLLAGLDALNLYRYLVDITHRGCKPIETDEVGWRRHYSTVDLTKLFGSRFTVRSIGSHRIGIAEIANAAFLALFRSFRVNESRYRRARSIVCKIERFEDRIRPGRSGTALLVEAVRL
jgi:SAM-dependent methyltransferase